MKTGNTLRVRQVPIEKPLASMEPGHEDREYKRQVRGCGGVEAASMEPGHEDREYPSSQSSQRTRTVGLNGARS